MPRAAVVVLVVVSLAGAAAAAAVAAGRERDTAFSLGVEPRRVAVSLPPGREVCQFPIDLVAAFDRIEVELATAPEASPTFEITVRRLPDGRLLGAGRPPRDYRPGPVQVSVGRVEAGPQAAVCIRPLALPRLPLLGGDGVQTLVSRTYIGERPLDRDLTMRFITDRPASLLALAPEIAERASLFRAPFVRGWLYFLLLGMLVAGAPLLLARAVRAATEG